MKTSPTRNIRPVRRSGLLPGRTPTRPGMTAPGRVKTKSQMPSRCHHASGNGPGPKTGTAPRRFRRISEWITNRKFRRLSPASVAVEVLPTPARAMPPFSKGRGCCFVPDSGLGQTAGHRDRRRDRGCWSTSSVKPWTMARRNRCLCRNRSSSRNSMNTGTVFRFIVCELLQPVISIQALDLSFFLSFYVIFFAVDQCWPRWMNRGSLKESLGQTLPRSISWQIFPRLLVQQPRNRQETASNQVAPAIPAFFWTWSIFTTVFLC